MRGPKREPTFSDSGTQQGDYGIHGGSDREMATQKDSLNILPVSAMFHARDFHLFEKER